MNMYSIHVVRRTFAVVKISARSTSVYSQCIFSHRRHVFQHRTTSQKSYLIQNISKNYISTSSSRCRKKVIASVKEKSSKPLFIPVPVEIKNDPDEVNIGEELAGKVTKEDISIILNTFNKRKPVRDLSQENGLEIRLFNQAFLSFRRYCLETENLPVELHLVFSDIMNKSGHPDDIFPFFMKHARQVFPHLDCIEELRNISDVRVPANWYPEARAMNRKIIFHAGPTNSGKTYHALERFFAAKTGVYCGPLKLLAVEIFNKSKQKGIPCDLITGEERSFFNEDGSQASHVACTVEMTSISMSYEVAVIDEIQMLRDLSRGWAWTRALLGIAAQEVHVCGEAAAIDIVQAIVESVEEEFEVCYYERLTKLTIEDTALGSLANVRNGDCIVCFSKSDIFNVSLQLERRGINCAVIYGALPPGTKLAQAQKFNDPSDPCKVLVATDAIGMGLNLSIQRVIFNSLIKPNVNQNGELQMECISASQALQIGGRAGRYGTEYENGYVTTFSAEDLPVLKNVMSQTVDPISAAGLLPTAEQLEMFAYNLPHASLSNLVDIFISICQLDLQHYFMCHIDNFKYLADMIQHIPLTLKARYVFCCAPINIQQTLVCTMFLKFARQFSQNKALTFHWLQQHLNWPFCVPQNISELVHLEAVFDTLDIYLWLSYRFQDLFLEANIVRDAQKELDLVIQQGVFRIPKMLKASETPNTSAILKAQDTEYLAKRTKDELRKGKANGVRPQVQNGGAVLNSMKFSDRLLAQGLLSSTELKKLKEEFSNENEIEKDKKKHSKRRK